jgi:tetratricopeptide (TPR) repeat protein
MSRKHVEQEVRPRIHHVGLTPILLDPRYGILRSPDRHPLSRQTGYENIYDFFTLFYDIFWSDSGEHVTAIGPPLPQVLDLKRDLKIQALPSNEQCEFKYRSSRKRPLPCYVSIKAPEGTQALVLSIGEQTWVSAIQPNVSHLFNRCSALVTISRDNDLQWIHDWAFHHAKECGVDAIVFYDNASVSYEVGDIALALGTVPGLTDVALIRQDAPFGPAGYPAGGGGSDSAYLKPAMFEHARYRFLALADLFINLDIDELLLLKTVRDLRSYADRDEPVILVDRKDVENFVEQPVADNYPQSHRNYWWRKRKPGNLLPKWVARPRACGPGTVFTYHQVDREQAWRAPTDELEISHFLALTTGWKSPARLQEVPRERAWGLVEDLDLRDRLSRTFGEHHTACRPWDPLRSKEPALQLRWARKLVQENRLEDARIVAEQTLEISPDLLGALELLVQLNEQLGDVGAATGFRDRIAQLTKGNPDWYIRRANYLRRKNLDTATQVLETAVGLGVESASLLILLGEFYERVDRLPEAAKVFTQALTLVEPNSQDAHQANEGLKRLASINSELAPTAQA